MRQRVKRIWAWAVVILTGVLVVCVGAGVAVASASMEHTMSVTSVKANTADALMMSGAGLHIRMECGLHGYVKYDRYMKVSAEIDNQGSDFSGWLQIITPTEDENNMYRKEFQVQAGEMKKLFLVFPACMSQNRIFISIKRSDGEEICSKGFLLNMDYGIGNVYIGVYSDKVEKFGFLEGKDAKVVYLSGSDFTDDYKVLDILDVLVISDKNMRRFPNKEISAIISWVKRGGTLVLADSGRHGELKPFYGKMVSWNVGETEKISTCFGLDIMDSGLIRQRLLQKLEEKKAAEVRQFLIENLSTKLYNEWRTEIAEIQDNSFCLEESGEIFSYLQKHYSKQELKRRLSLSVDESEQEKLSRNIQIPEIQRRLTDIQVEGAEVLLSTEKKKVLLQKVSVGIGNLIVSGCSLAMKEKYWDVLGGELLDKIMDNLSEKKKRQQFLDQHPDYNLENYIYGQGLLVTEKDRLPNLNLYGAILIIYVILCGPVLFFLFWRKRKSGLLWGAIPAVSILFSVFIYLVGTSTRIQNPYVNYLSHLQLKGNGQAVLQTWFRLTSGQNHPYEVGVKGNCDIEPLIAFPDYQISNESDKDWLTEGYQYGIEYKSKQTKIMMEELAAFEGKNFKDEEIVSEEGDVEIDLSSSDMNLHGEVTNTLSYDLEDCFLFDNGTLYYLGNIDAGKCVSVDSLDGEDIYQQNEYNYDFSDLVLQLFGANYWTSRPETDCEMQRRAVLAQGYMEGLTNSETGFLGFVPSGNSSGNMFMNKFSYDKYGAMCVSKQTSLRYTSKGLELFPDISEYAFAYDSNVTDGKVVKDTSQSRIQVSYRLPEGYQWKGLTYNQSNNAEFSQFDNEYYGSDIFSGVVTMTDRNTGQEAVIFESGREMNLELYPEDISEDGVLTLYYYLDTSSGNMLQLPNIMVSVTKTSKEHDG